MSPIAERLYQLLPAFYRANDLAQGEPLRALLGVLETELQAVRDDVDGLYDNWFVETCAPWVVAYLGDLVGADPLPSPLPGTDDGRAYVANALGYRRRKGTAAALSAVVGDLSTWPALGVELFRLVAAQQSLSHQRPGNVRTPSLRQGDVLSLVGTPFDPVPRSADLRRPGRYSLGNVGVFVWRLKAYPVNAAPAAAVTSGAPPSAFRFDALGRDTPLFNALRTLSGGAAPTEATVPGPLSRAPVSEALEAARQALAQGKQPPANPYFDRQPAFQIVVGGAPVPPEQILIADLSAWQAPPPFKVYGSVTLPIAAAVDPERGRILFSSGIAAPTGVRVSYQHGFSSEVGGGFYDRSATLASAPAPVSVAGGGAADPIGAAFAPASPLPSLQTVVQIADSLVYAPAALSVPAGASYTLQAADKQRPLLRPAGPWSLTLGPGATLTLNGLLLDADLHVSATGPATLALVHCTLVPGRQLVGSGPLTVTLTRCITGAVALDAGALSATDTILDGAGLPAVHAGATATLTGCTVLGPASAGSLTATDTLFCGALTLGSTATGSVSTSFVPDGTAAPGSLAGNLCQPALALGAGAPADRAAILARVQPSFTSTTYGDPGYAQLRRTAAPEIRTGGSDGSEMGVFHHLYQPQMEANVSAGLGNYLRLGLTPTVFFVT